MLLVGLHACVCVYVRALSHRCDHICIVTHQLVSHASAQSPDDAVLRFWHAFALHKNGAHDDAIALLTPLAENRDLSLASVALLLTAHNSRSNRDKKVLMELKARLKSVSKSSSEASLLLAGRFFLYTGKLPKARQCVEKLVAKNKVSVHAIEMRDSLYQFLLLVCVCAWRCARSLMPFCVHWHALIPAPLPRFRLTLPLARRRAPLPPRLGVPPQWRR